ncbi:hypothetical protein TA3x_002631 [Tundrisphaera sp. TA3]|uniref:hypothetical protein n=1 Tax=Tundrisphaera sp. TA3 TaxID=3435775 RepID=UPI003EBF8790
MTGFPRRVPPAIVLALGVLLGWAVSWHPSPTAKATGGDRYGDWAVTTGAISVQYNDATKTQATQEAVYFLDYRGARLLATIPAIKISQAGSKLVEGFVERDLTADFKLDVERGPAPHFLMTTGTLGGYGDGWAPLFVFETTTKQMAAYRLQPQIVGASGTRPKFDLLEIRPFAGQPQAPPQ